MSEKVSITVPVCNERKNLEPFIAALNADTQNDPADIPAMLAKLPEGYDAASCWRQRSIPLKWAKALISRLSGARLHDDSCTLKAYQREVVEPVRLYGEMHRFIPFYASWAGARVAEIQVRHHARASGASKHGLSRTDKVILDLVTVKMLGSCSTKPMYFYGGVDLIACSGAFVCALLTLYEKNLAGVKAHHNPLLPLAVFLFLLGIQFLLVGLVAALVIQPCFESQGKTPFIVRQGHNFS